MTVSENEPADARDAIADTDRVISESVGATSVFAPALQGWLEIADVVSDTDPALAELMIMGAHIVRAALEEQILSVLSELSEDLGLSRAGRDQLEGALCADSLPFTADELAMQISDTFGTVSPASAGPASAESASTAAIDEILRAFVRSPRMAMRGVSRQYEKARSQVRQAIESGDNPQWTAVCSLELPGVLGAHTPIYCKRRGHRWVSGGAHLGALELTYLQATEYSFEGQVCTAGQVGRSGAGGGYRSTLDQAFPPPFYGEIGVDALGVETGLSAWSYALHLVEGPGYRRLTKVSALLSRQRQNIETHVGALVQRSEQRVRNVLTAVAIPPTLMNPLVELINKAAGAVVGFIVDFVVKQWSENPLSTWTVWHTVLIGTARVPISVFTLMNREGGSPRLRRLLAPKSDGTPVTDEEYDDNIFNLEQELQARFLVGSSDPGLNLFNHRYFDEVGRTGRPLAWQEPLETGSGLRLLVPHLDRPRDAPDAASRAAGSKNRDEGAAALSKITYISAVRADVRMTGAKYSPASASGVIRRPTGRGGTFDLSAE